VACDLQSCLLSKNLRPSLTHMRRNSGERHSARRRVANAVTPPPMSERERAHRLCACSGLAPMNLKTSTEALDVIERERGSRETRRALVRSQTRGERERERASRPSPSPLPTSPMRQPRRSIATESTPAILKTRRFAMTAKTGPLKSSRNRRGSSRDNWQRSRRIEACVNGERPRVRREPARTPAAASCCDDRGENSPSARRAILSAHASERGARASARPLVPNLRFCGRAISSTRALDYVALWSGAVFDTARSDRERNLPRAWQQLGPLDTERFAQSSDLSKHIRAIAGWPRGDCSRHSDVVMENLDRRD